MSEPATGETGSDTRNETSTLARTREIVLVLFRHGPPEWLRDVALGVSPDEIDPGAPESLAADLESLGATFVKLGQMLSTRPDLLPAPYVEALGRLQSSVAPVPWAVIEETVEGELGAPISRHFASFDRDPLASASLGQVHRASLPDGTRVAVKVQRPNLRGPIERDLSILGRIAHALDQHTSLGRTIGLERIIDELGQALLRELDYTRERSHLERLAENLADHPSIVVPRPFPEQSTGRVLTMDYVEGIKVTAIDAERRARFDAPTLADELFAAYLDQVLVHGFVHADPHPGNLLLTADDRLALLDLGLVTELTQEIRDDLLKLLLGIAGERPGDVAELLLELGEVDGEIDRTGFRRGIARLIRRARRSTVGQGEFGRLLVELVGVSSAAGVRPPPELSLLAKTLLQLDQAAAALDPDFDPLAAVERHAQGVLTRSALQGLAPESIASAGLELRELVGTAPRRLNAFFRDLSSNRLAVRVDVIDEERFLTSLQRMTNRLSVAVVLAALILGSALFARIETSLTLFGYPALALGLFALAAACGFYLVFDVFRSDRTTKRR